MTAYVWTNVQMYQYKVWPNLFSGDIKDTSNIKLLHRFCENERSRYLYVTEETILITFITNSLREAGGFRFNIRVIPMSRMFVTTMRQ